MVHTTSSINGDASRLAGSDKLRMENGKRREKRLHTEWRIVEKRLHTEWRIVVNVKIRERGQRPLAEGRGERRHAIAADPVVRETESLPCVKAGVNRL